MHSPTPEEGEVSLRTSHVEIVLSFFGLSPLTVVYSLVSVALADTNLASRFQKLRMKNFKKNGAFENTAQERYLKEDNKCT